MLLMAQTAGPRVAVVNFSTLLDTAVSYNFTKSLQTQVHRDFAPLWGVDCIVAAKTPAQIQPYHWVLGIFDNSTQANVLGFHDLTPSGKPIMKVFVADANNAGVPISAVASHELLETLADPFTEALSLRENGGATGTLFAYEVCDPVEADVYAIYGNQVSNFVLPWWFGAPPPAGSGFDFSGALTGPFTASAGGSFSFREITTSGLQPWQVFFADESARSIAGAFNARRAHGVRRP